MSRKTYSSTTFDAMIKGGLPNLTMGKDQFPPFAPERLYNVEEAGAYLRIGPRSVYRWIEEGRLKASFVGRSHLIRESSLVEFVKQSEQDSSWQSKKHNSEIK